MRNLDHLEMPAADLATATAMLADLVCDLGSAKGRLHEDAHAKAIWVANRVRDEMKAFFETVVAGEWKPRRGPGGLDGLPPETANRWKVGPSATAGGYFYPLLAT